MLGELHPLFRFCSNPRSRSRARSSPLSFDTGPRHRRCSPTNPRNASNKRGRPRCCSSERREELCRTFARTSSSFWAGNRTPTQTRRFLPSETEFAHSEEYQYLTIFKNKRYAYIYFLDSRNGRTDTLGGYLFAAYSENSKRRGWRVKKRPETYARAPISRWHPTPRRLSLSLVSTELKSFLLI